MVRQGRSLSNKEFKNVRCRVVKGLSQIMGILETVSFGKYFLQIAMTFRETMFPNGVLTNAKIWNNLKKCEREEFANN